MKLGIMQPYLFPYFGYFQLINTVDTFVIYDDVAYIKNGWINRNRLKVYNEGRYFTVPLAGASPFQPIRNTKVAVESYERFRKKFYGTLASCYGKSDYYNETLLLLKKVFDIQPTLIGEMARHSIITVCCYLGIPTRIVSTSTIYNNSSLAGADRLIDICRKEGADTYINTIGGRELYKKMEFSNAGIDLWFLDSQASEYPQSGGGEFIPNLSIIDVLMNNPVDTVRKFLTQYKLV